jgi:AcrB/AcrD/AcrF family
MIAGMVPMALGLGEGGEQSSPLGRAVIGGLAVATCATLLILPAVFTVVMGGLDQNPIGAILVAGMPGFLRPMFQGASTGSASLHPDDADGACYSPETASHGQEESHSHGHSAGHSTSHETAQSAAGSGASSTPSHKINPSDPPSSAFRGGNDAPGSSEHPKHDKGEETK